MSGLVLEEMDASDMLDVIHYCLEDDMFVATGEEAEAKSDIRKVLYRQLYEREYKSAIDTSRSKSSRSGSTYADGSPIGPSEDDFADLEPFDTSGVTREKKPFIPATDFNPDAALPFGKDLDAPLG